MNVRELIDMLEEYDPDRQVALADPEDGSIRQVELDPSRINSPNVGPILALWLDRQDPINVYQKEDTCD